MTTEYCNLLISKLNESLSNPLKNGVNDMSNWYNCLTFDIMADLCFTESFHALENGAYHPWMEIILDAARWGGTIRFLRAYPLLFMLAKAAKYITSGTTEINTARKAHMQYAIEKTEKRLNMNVDRADIVNPVCFWRAKIGLLSSQGDDWPSDRSWRRIVRKAWRALKLLKPSSCSF